MICGLVEEQYHLGVFPVQMLHIVKEMIAVRPWVLPEELGSIIRQCAKPACSLVGTRGQYNRPTALYGPDGTHLCVIDEDTLVFNNYRPARRLACQVFSRFFKNMSLSSCLENAYLGLGFIFAIPHD